MEISIEKTIEIFQGMKKGIYPWYPEEYYNFAIDIMRRYQNIQQIKNDALYDIYMAGVNMTGEYQGCWVRFKDIENIVNEHFSGGLDKNSQKLENPTTTNDLGVDYISKQEVVSLMMHIWGKNHSGDDAIQECIDAIREMPSVTPQESQSFKWCTDCKEYDQEKHCCHRWSKVIRDTVEEMKQEPILEKLRAEIEQYQSDYDVHGTEYDRTAWKAFNRCLQIIDKYKAESENT